MDRGRYVALKLVRNIRIRNKIPNYRILLMILILVICLPIIFIVVPVVDTGTYLHVADFHYDWTHVSYQNDYSLFGATWEFIESAIGHMATACPKPDFIIWTGDSIGYLPHLRFNTSNVVEVIKKITITLSTKFPNAKIYPVLGNHDYKLDNYALDDGHPVYQEANKLWSNWIGKQQTFAAYGYYKAMLSDSIVLLGLNTNFYLKKNNVALKNPKDPGGQFAWMDLELNRAKNANMKAIIIAHVPPGAYGHIANFMLMSPKYNEQFLDIITKYAAVIKYMYFGHTHDSFRVVLDSSNKPVVPIFIAPAMQPDEHSFPGYRVITYNRQSFDIISYRQYYSNLAKADSHGAHEWELEYEFPNVYSLADITPQGMFNLQQRLVNNWTLFNLYYQLSSGNKLINCNDVDCRRKQLCALQFLRFNDYSACMTQAI